VGDRLRYAIDAELCIVELLGPDGPSPKEVEQVLKAVVADSAFRPGCGFLRDRRGFQMQPVGLVHGLSRVIRELPEIQESRWAVVVSDQGNYGMTRMLQILADLTELRIFEDPDLAKRWLASPRVQS